MGGQVAVLRMTNVAFTYPGTTRQVLKDVTVRCNLNSRVAVLGVRSSLQCLSVCICVPLSHRDQFYSNISIPGAPACMCVSEYSAYEQARVGSRTAA